MSFPNGAPNITYPPLGGLESCEHALAEKAVIHKKGTKVEREKGMNWFPL
jgi:hypothetical protein